MSYGRFKRTVFRMAEQLDISLVERQRCAIEFLNPKLIHQAYGDDAMRRATVFKLWRRFRGGETNVKGQNRLFHLPVDIM
jgi:hypothetical protein